MTPRPGATSVLTLTVLTIAALVLLASSSGAGPLPTQHVGIVLDPTHEGTGFDWLQYLIGLFEAESKQFDVSYGLFVPSGQGFSHVGTGSASWVNGEIANLASFGPGDIDGLLGVMEALEPTAGGDFPSQVWLVTDGSRAVWDGTLTGESVRNACFAAQTYLNAVVDHGFTDGSGTNALGVMAAASYYADGAGGYLVQGPAAPGAGDAGVIEDYVLSAHTAWDLGQAASGDALVRDSFGKAFTDVKLAETGGMGGGVGMGGPPGFMTSPIVLADPPPPIPEPGAGILVVAGAALLLLFRRRR